jgi:hypothetical protein
MPWWWSVFFWWRKQEYPEKTNHRPVASHWQTVSHNVASSSPCMSEFQFHNFSGGSTYCIGTTTIQSWQPGKSTMASSCNFIITTFKLKSKYLSEKTKYTTTWMKLAMSLVCSVIISLLYSLFKGHITALLTVSDHCVNYSLSWCDL